MPNFLRKNAWNQQGTFNNTDLLWYAKGVGVMQSRALNDESSWWFFAAIHGEYISETSFPGWGSIPGPPSVPTTPVPSQSVQNKFWNQCQHQSWYFTPWHRGYLIALEAQIRSAIVGLGGPSTWALPYWNYFGPQNQYRIPPAFTQQRLPDGSPNPLYVNARFGPTNNRNIYIAIPPVSQACQGNTIFTGSNTATPSPGYGGPSTGFSHSGSVSGNLENNPHNIVHVQVGGSSGNIWGLMSDPGIAALDPIFYLHHSNIDRMWASWNSVGNVNPTNQNWLNGPAASGARAFVMPMPNGTSWVYKPSDVNSLSQLDYNYDDLTGAKSPRLVTALAQRLTKLGVSSIDTSLEKIMDLGTNSELVGANEGQLKLDGSGLQTTVKLDNKAWKNVPTSLMKASATSLPDQVYLQIENVKGNMDANILTVSINHELAGHVSLFGLRNASKQDGQHGGTGLTFIFNISNIIDNLHLDNALDVDSLDVAILPSNAISDNQEVTVGRVSIYREQQQP
tara:strand:+ start:2347 stop:3870 length:1524 start_codon:yes stop_codon:yes gene_type:complete